jgi:hypothetical protein
MEHGREHRQTPQEPAGTAAAVGTADSSGATERRLRFGTLPERIRPQDTVETRPATLPDPARDRYDPDEWMVRYCL